MDVNDEDDSGPWAAGEEKVNKIVFIGKSLDQQKIREAFDALFVSKLPQKTQSLSSDGAERRFHPVFGQVTLEELRSRLPTHDTDTIWTRMADVNPNA